MKYLVQAVFYLFLAGGLLHLAYDHFSLYQRLAVERRDKELAQSNETSLKMERDQLKYITQVLYAERVDLKNDLAACLSHVVNADDTGNPMP